MKKVILICLLLGVAYVYDAQAQKTAVHWYLPTMSLEEASRLKGYDLIMVDPEIIFNNRASLDALRADNPRLKIYCYFNVAEWFFPMWEDKPWSKNIVAFLDKKEEWFLHGKDGKRLNFWTDERTGKRMLTMNCRIDCPRLPVYSINEKMSYIEFITDRFIQDILKTYPFNGVLRDNLWYRITWLGKYGTNKSGWDYGPIRDNDSLSVNLLWKQGTDYSLNEIKKFGGSDFIIIGNPGHLSYPQCSGKMFENFPEVYLNRKDTIYEAWFENMNNASAFSAGPCIFNARKDNYFFTLCSSMLLNNVYFSYLQNTKYESKYRLDLGKPLAPALASNGIHSRAYENGTVFVNPFLKKAWVVYKDGHTRNE
ncbi:MAG: putative glycoside hydrolase [Candidatus Falkowbacteria bacterium]|nr:putative glycoside hydrolase [Candidatus Falkowbacteria bacterium]